MAKIVGGRYQLIAQLGGGGMADVYLAKTLGDFSKLAVVKRLKSPAEEDSEAVRMFHDEARLCARLNHPNIVQTFEVGADDEGPFLVMEYLEGQPLSRMRSRAANRRVAVPLGVWLHTLSETLLALQYAHGVADHDGTPLSVVHRDVSPQNVVVTYAGTSKLVDFGVAKTTASLSRTRAGVLKGKVAYMAPEQARSDAALDGRADVFSAGLILWELLTGKRMWEGCSEVQVIAALLEREPLRSPRELDPGVPHALDRVCARAIAKDRDARFASAAEMLEALEAACDASGLRSSAREVSGVIASLFADEREKMRKLVTGVAGEPTEDGDRLPRLAHRPYGAAPTVPPAPSAAPGEPEGQLSSSSTGNMVESRPRASSAATSPGRSNTLGIATAALALVAVVLLAARSGQPPAPPAAPSTPAEPRAVAEPPAKPPEVVVDLSAKPAHARIFIDGKEVPGNPHRVQVPRSEEAHEIRAEADGYQTRSLTFPYDRDRSVELSLAKKPPPWSLAPPRPPLVSEPAAPDAAAPAAVPTPTPVAPLPPTVPPGALELPDRAAVPADAGPRPSW